MAGSAPPNRICGFEPLEARTGAGPRAVGRLNDLEASEPAPDRDQMAFERAIQRELSGDPC
jgi:hypothetical protein